MDPIQRIQDEMAAREIGILKMSMLSGVPQGTLQNMLRRGRVAMLTFERFAAICRALELEPADLGVDLTLEQVEDVRLAQVQVLDASAIWAVERGA